MPWLWKKSASLLPFLKRFANISLPASSEKSYGGNCSFSSHCRCMSSFIEYGPLTKSCSFTLGNFSVKNFWKARASAAGSGVSAAAAGSTAVNATAAANATAADVEWSADRTFNLPGVFERRDKTLLNLCRRRIADAFVIDPADFQIVTLLGTLEAELDVGVLGNGRSPVRDEYVLAVVFESQLLDEMRRDRLALWLPDEAGIHRVLNERLDFGGLTT